GSGYELAEYPHHAKLSAATPDHPVWLVRKDAHSGLANAKSMEGGKGYPLDGVFLESEMSMIEDLIPDQSPAADFLAAQRDAMQFGITGVHDAMVDEEYLRLLRSLEDGRTLRLRVHAMFWHDDPDRVIDFMRSTKPVSGRLSVRAIKLFMDGSLGSSTAWMLEPYCSPTPGQGIARLTAADVERIGRVALETGWQMCVHAIGDRANRELLGAYERVNPPAEARWRIEHAQHVHPADLPRFARWIASVQPSHCVADRKMVENKLGPGRSEGCYAWKRLGPLALGTDAPVERLDPRRTFTSATTRDGWQTSQCLTPAEALRGMTAGVAHAGFMDSG
ncbi:MAG: amidohydrolase family protein, partial [Actinobacteria bacterium]|nr:amidohydrolase family protein [Actinomycetota bacterium]